MHFDAFVEVAHLVTISVQVQMIQSTFIWSSHLSGCLRVHVSHWLYFSQVYHASKVSSPISPMWRVLVSVLGLGTLQ